MIERKFGIVIPCFNESGNLEKIIEECKYISKKGPFEFVLVNNGSSDQSGELLDNLESTYLKTISLEKNAGYGGGILSGLKILETEYVGWIHADLQINLRDSLLGLEKQSFDFFKGTRSGRTILEKFLSAGMGILCSLIFRTVLYEINAQPTVMKRTLFQSWTNPPTDFSLDLYALVFAKKKKAKIRRKKFEFSKRSSGHSAWNFGLKSRVKMINRTLSYAFLLSKNGIK